MQVSQVWKKVLSLKFILRHLTSQVSDTMAQSNGFIATVDEDDKPMLIMKKSIDSQGNGLTALINKQLQGEVGSGVQGDSRLFAFGFWMWNEKQENPLMEFFSFPPP